MCIRAAATAAIQNAHAAASTVAASTTATRALNPKNEESMKICVRTWLQKIDLKFSTTNRLQMEKD